MPTDLDPEDDDSEPVETGRKSDSKPKGSDTEDYKARFNGANRKVTELTKQLEQIQALLDKKIVDYEDQLSTERRKPSVEEATKTLNAEKTAAEKDRDDAIKRLAGYEAKEQARKAVAEKYPQLVKMFEDDVLRNRTEFADDATFDAYLTKMASHVSVSETPEQPVPDSSIENALRGLLGTVPSGPPPVSSLGSKGQRTAEVISAEMDRLDPRDAAQSSKYDALFAELNAALG